MSDILTCLLFGCEGWNITIPIFTLILIAVLFISIIIFISMKK